MKQNSGSGGGVAERLLEDFPAPSLDQWQDEVVRLLKGASFEKRMLSTTIDGITLRPIYTRSDTADLDRLLTPPGTSPFLRGVEPPGRPAMRWEVAQELPYPDPRDFNRFLRHDLERGQTAVNLVLDNASSSGLDADEAGDGLVGRGGTSIGSLDDLLRALDGVDLEKTPLLVQTGPAAPAFAALLWALCGVRGIDPARLSGAVGFDPLAELAAKGRLPMSLERAWDGQALFSRWAERVAPNLKTVLVQGWTWHEAGAGAAEELAFSMGSAVQALREAEKRGLEIEQAARRFYFCFAVGTDFFAEIAKFRAARLLWSRIVGACGAGGSVAKLTFHARSSGWSTTLFDPHTNILRCTTQAFAAIAGGCGSLHLRPFDERYGLPGELSRRLARNTQLVLRDESHFDRVADPAGGSWYVETLTEELARKAWELFQEVESAGGMEQALRRGGPQAILFATAEKRRENLARGRDVLVGTNRYPDPGAAPLDHCFPDYQALEVRSRQRLRALRRGDDPARERALERLAASSPGGGVPDLELMAGTAAQGLTMGELSRWFASIGTAEQGVLPVRAGHGGDRFESLRSGVSRDTAGNGPPLVLLAAMGPPAGYMARLEFIRSFYQVGGFSVLGDLSFDTVEQAVAAAGEHRPAAVCIVSRDDRYAELVPTLAAGLLAAVPGLVIHMAGGPAAGEAACREAGIRQVITLRTDMPLVLSELAVQAGVMR
jgi:methylmalonyl-CoA mutase